MRIFRKSVEIIQVSIKSDKNNGYFTRTPMLFLLLLLLVSPSTALQSNADPRLLNGLITVSSVCYCLSTL